jgi:DNA-binding transcriptional LysR family regulator
MFDSLFSEGGLSLERLKVLIEVHDAGSIAQSAPGDMVRQSQYSRQLRELAQFFGCEVTERRGKLLKLTPEGARLAEMAREFLRGLNDFHTECRSEKVVFNLGAGDSLIQWLVIPQLGRIIQKQPGARFGTLNLRTQEIVHQVADSRVDFGLVRKNALVAGLKSATLGMLTYVAVIPEALTVGKQPPTLTRFFTDYPLAMQTTEGEFTKRLYQMAHDEKTTLRPGLACQSFPQVFAAVKSERFAAVLPEIAARDLPAQSFRLLRAAPLRQLQREIVLIWKPRVIKVRPGAAEMLTHIQSILCFH